MVDVYTHIGLGITSIVQPSRDLFLTNIGTTIVCTLRIMLSVLSHVHIQLLKKNVPKNQCNLATFLFFTI